LGQLVITESAGAEEIRKRIDLEARAEIGAGRKIACGGLD
jgi:hypothetical protein